VVEDAAGDFEVPICWCGLPGGSRHGVTSRGGFSSSRYVDEFEIYCLFLK
jgi:hypothetical protein